MTRHNWLAVFGVFLLTASAGRQSAAANEATAASAATAAVDLFRAMDDDQVDVKFIARSDHDARILITNKTKQPINLQLPEAFAGVPVLAQFGGGGGGLGGRGGGGGGLGGGGLGGGGGQQSVGGGLGGGGLGGGGLGGGGGGGFFSIPPEQTAKLNVPVVCLDHGLRDPSSSKPYKIVPASEHLDRPAVIELLKAFGRGELQHDAAQAAAWHLNNDLSFDELAAKRTGTRRSLSRAPYFSADEIHAAMTYAGEAIRLAEQNADLYQRERKGTAADENSSEQRSTTEVEVSASPTATE